MKRAPRVRLSRSACHGCLVYGYFPVFSLTLFIYYLLPDLFLLQPRLYNTMVHRCVVFGCGNITQDSVRLHGFPSDPTLVRRWRRFVTRTRAKWNGPSSTSVICSAHFKEEDFENSVQFSMGLANKRILRKCAVPSVYPQGTCRTQATAHCGGIVEGGPNTATTRGAYRKREAARVSIFTYLSNTCTDFMSKTKSNIKV